MIRNTLTVLSLIALAMRAGADEPAWQQHRGKPGPGGWRCHVIQPDPQDHGPDGINLHDWDGDGDVDVFVNYEEGKFSRLYFNPGSGTMRELWPEHIEFKHGQCEDSGIGDLDDDGDIDYVANGGWIYFNPGKADVRDAKKWVKMTLFDHEQRVPTVADVDGDGLDDLIVGAQAWFKQPVEGKHVAKNWQQFALGSVKWPMNCLRHDIDGDGDLDLVVPDRREEIFWFENLGGAAVTAPWPRHRLHDYTHPMFMAVGDLDQDGRADFAIASGEEGKGKYHKKLIVLLRTNRGGTPTFDEIIIDQPCGNFPKGVAILELDGDPGQHEILVTPKQGPIWSASFRGDPSAAANWKAVPIETPGDNTRKKMDNVYLGDLDGDGDQDVITTEENSGWGVIWFENPGAAAARAKQK